MQVKVATFEKELRRIRSDLAPLRNKHTVISEHLADEEGKVAQAQAFISKAHDIGLAAFPNKSVAEVQTEYERSLGRLAAAGIVIERRDIAVGKPRWARHIGEATHG